MSNIEDALGRKPNIEEALDSESSIEDALGRKPNIRDALDSR